MRHGAKVRNLEVPSDKQGIQGYLFAMQSAVFDEFYIEAGIFIRQLIDVVPGGPVKGA